MLTPMVEENQQITQLSWKFRNAYSIDFAIYTWGHGDQPDEQRIVLLGRKRWLLGRRLDVTLIG